MTPLGKRTCPACDGTGKHPLYDGQACYERQCDGGTVDTEGPVDGSEDCPCGEPIVWSIDICPPILHCKAGHKWWNGEPYEQRRDRLRSPPTTRVTEAGLIVPKEST